MMRHWIASLVFGLGAAAQAQALVVLGENAGGRQILVDVTSLKASPPISGARNFTAMQLFVEMRNAAGRGSVEQVRYSFSCSARTVATIHYAKTVNGHMTHNWDGADNSLKYDPVAPGTLVEQAMTYACNGGKLPVRPAVPAAGIGSTTDGEDKDGDGG